MGNIKKKNLVLLSFFFFLYLTCSKEFQYSKNLGWPPSEAPLSSYPHDDHEFYDTEPPYNFFKKQIIRDEEGLGSRNSKKTRALKLKNNRGKRSSDRRTYTAMLPKGFVPPSGSSPCHNTYPNSITFFCHLSNNNKSP